MFASKILHPVQPGTQKALHDYLQVCCVGSSSLNDEVIRVLKNEAKIARNNNCHGTAKAFELAASVLVTAYDELRMMPPSTRTD